MARSRRSALSRGSRMTVTAPGSGSVWCWWVQAALTAPTAAERIAAGAAAGRQIMERTGALFAVAQQAAAVEPLIAAQWQQGREQTRYAHAVFWTRMAEDGLLDPGLDLDWLIDTSTILA